MPAQGPFFKVLSLSTSGVRKLSGYTASLVLFLWGLTKLQAPVQRVTGRSEPWLVAPVAALPLLLVATFELAPKAWSRYKAAKLTNYGFSIAQEVSTYFRIAPYEDTEQDRHQFRRADNIQQRVLVWIQSTPETILYLTGRSGTGKTSLINAHILPELRNSKEFLPFVVRSFADPLPALRRHLLSPGIIWKQPVDDPSEALFDLLRRAAAKTNKRIVLIFEQFEETLIASPSDRPTHQLRAFVERLHAMRSQEVLVVISIRDDYIALLEEMNLPKLVQRQNWFNVSAFTEHASRTFLDNSGLVIRPHLMEEIISQAREIEDSQGMIRPVTLNMIGLVLSATANTSQREVVTRRGLERMIKGYILDAIQRSEIKPFAPAIVRKMYTKNGLKCAMSVDALARATKLPPTVVTKCLLLLSERGLTRRVDPDQAIWEISHDFVAKLLRDVLSGWQALAMKIAGAAVLPTLLLTWLLILLVFVPGWQDDHLIQLVTRAGGTAQKLNGELKVNLPSDPQMLAEIIHSLSKSPSLVELDLSQTEVTDAMLGEIASAKSLRVLNLNETNISDVGLEHIRSLKHLRELYLRNTPISNRGLSSLTEMGEMQIIVLGGTHVTDEGFFQISRLPELREVYLNYTGISAYGLAGLEGATHLNRLEMDSSAVSDSGLDNIIKLRGLRSLSLAKNRLTKKGICELTSMQELRSLNISDDKLDASVAGCLAQFKHLTDLDLSQSKLDDAGATALSRITTLENLTIKETRITDAALLSLRRIPRLRYLSVPVTRVTDNGMRSVAEMSSLRELYIGGTAVTDRGIQYLTQLPDLRVLYLRGCKGVTDASLTYLYAVPNLEKLSVSGTSTSRNAVTALEKARPKLSVEE
jgi:Leucine-rich repeat (LRR) protein